MNARYASNGNPIRPTIGEVRRWADTHLTHLSDVDLLRQAKAEREAGRKYHYRVVLFIYHTRIVDALSAAFPDP